MWKKYRAKKSYLGQEQSITAIDIWQRKETKILRMTIGQWS